MVAHLMLTLTVRGKTYDKGCSYDHSFHWSLWQPWVQTLSVIANSTVTTPVSRHPRTFQFRDLVTLVFRS